jgi:hypothetical protein
MSNSFVFLDSLNIFFASITASATAATYAGEFLGTVASFCAARNDAQIAMSGFPDFI